MTRILLVLRQRGRITSPWWNNGNYLVITIYAVWKCTITEILYHLLRNSQTPQHIPLIYKKISGVYITTRVVPLKLQIWNYVCGIPSSYFMKHPSSQLVIWYASNYCSSDTYTFAKYHSFIVIPLFYLNLPAFHVASFTPDK